LRNTCEYANYAGNSPTLSEITVLLIADKNLDLAGLGNSYNLGRYVAAYYA